MQASDAVVPVAQRHQWMRTALALLFDRYSMTDCLAIVRDPAELEKLKHDLSGRLVSEKTAPPIPGAGSDNILLGIVALRMKFSRSEAESKLELNITMRGDRG